MKKHVNVKYTENQVRKVFEMMEEGYYTYEISDNVGIPCKYLCEMFKGKVWKYVYKDINIYK